MGGGGEDTKPPEYGQLRPAALRLFISWLRQYVNTDLELVLQLHLHEGNDEMVAMSYWRRILRLPDAPFHKTFVKPRGTGHRKNHLQHGVCTVKVRAASDHWHRIMAWMDEIMAWMDELSERLAG